MNSEVGPVVVPKEWDYAAARMRKSELQSIGQSAESMEWRDIGVLE